MSVISPQFFADAFAGAQAGLAVVGLEGRCLAVNPALCRMLGFSERELLSRTVFEIAREAGPSSLAEIQRVLAGTADSMRAGPVVLDGRERPVRVGLGVSLVRDEAGRPVRAVVQVDEQALAGGGGWPASTANRGQEVERLSRLYAALSHINQSVARAPGREELFRSVCRALVEEGGFMMAWVGWHDPATQRLMPVAEFGDEHGYLRTIEVYADDRPLGQGPSGRSFRSGEPYVSSDMLSDPTTGPWREELRARGFRASAVFPIRVAGAVKGTLSVYADEPWCFQDREIGLLVEAARNISFALDNFVRDVERAEAEVAALSEKIFSDTMIESMPGVLYFYDQHGRFLRWNRSFELATGYSGRELAGMSPLDFFADEEKSLVRERIAEVFRDGESAVEASLVSKGGGRAPYFFTGRRIEFNGQPCLVGVGIDISERRQAEQALRESEGRLRVLFEQAPLGIGVLDSSTGRFLTVNPQYCRIAGYSEAEMLGLSFPLITHPDDIAADMANMERMRQGCLSAYQLEKRYLRKDGSTVWVSLTCVPLSGGLDLPGVGRRHIAMVEDISERKRAKELLAESERKYRELVELANSIILRWDSGGRITFLNEYGQKFFGYSGAEILGCHVVGTIVPPSDTVGRDLRGLMDQICANPQAFEKNINENMRRGGERVWIAWTNRILRDSLGRVVEILSVGTDITEQRRAEIALRELNEHLEARVAERTAEMQAAVSRAEEADRIKSAFLANMSHELRTPLNSIIGFTGILLQGLAGALNEEQARQLGMVRSSSRHLLELINDVLDISKIEANQLQVASAPFELPEAIARVLGLVRPLAARKGLELVSSVHSNLGPMTGDRRRVEQILLNLLNNAIKFTECGRVTLEAEPLDAYRPAPDAPPRPAVRLRVGDTGMGIRPADLATLFQPFRQIDSGLTRQHEGTGLGLAICRRLASLMGGEISAASEWSRGSEFTVILPLQTNTHP